MSTLDELLVRLNLDVTGLANLLRVVSESPIVTGRIVAATILSADTSALVAHGLGRAYRGAVVVSQSAATELRVDAPSTDAATYLTLRAAAAPGADLTVSLWVY